MSVAKSIQNGISQRDERNTEHTASEEGEEDEEEERPNNFKRCSMYNRTPNEDNQPVKVSARFVGVVQE